MEQYGFARSGVAGEYAPLFVHKNLDTDQSVTGTTFVELMRLVVTTESPSENLVILFNIDAITVSTGNTPWIQVYVDNTLWAGARQTNKNAAGSCPVSVATVATNISPGRHNVIIKWRSANTGTVRCRPATQPLEGADLTVIRDQVTSDREMDGVGRASWPVMYTCGSVYSELGSDLGTDSNASPTTLLVSANITTHAPSSALLIRFESSGTATTATATVAASAKYQVYVDGVAYYGTGASGSSTVNSRYSASIITVYGPVAAGAHTVQIYWGGGAGSTITPSSDTEGARLTVKEIFCPDFGNAMSDMAGFPALFYDSRNVPQVRAKVLTSNVTGVSSNLDAGELLRIDDLHVKSDNSVFLIETSTSCGLTATGASFTLVLSIDVLDNNGFVEIERRISENFATSDIGVVSLMYTWVVSLPPANYYRIRTSLLGTGATCDVVNHPEYNHHSLVVREMNQSGAYINN